MRHLLMRNMAIVASDVLDIVLILVKAALANALLLVTGRAHGHHLPRRGFAGIEDRAYTPTRLHVLTPWPVTHLAALDRRNILRALDGGEVRRVRQPSVLVGMAHFAGIRPNIILGPWWRRLGLLSRWRLSLLFGLSR